MVRVAQEQDSAVLQVSELAAPEFFLNATSARERDRVSARCVTSNPLVTNIFFCQDGRLIFDYKTEPKETDYTLLLNISQHSTGHYSCSYQQKDGNNSRLSADRKLTVPPEHSGTQPGFAAFVILIPTPLLYFLIKKGEVMSS
ncbi:hypothetical protein lerEdw1_004202 [Lerista edwardsae]|nr:hypothetical protein lerEdw1_004203 [Lerista edwardsae]KAJ6650737.1 hypothetical protein lerEdw1_004202 [Lerista edwardsae]